MRAFFLQPIHDVMAMLETLASAMAARPKWRLALLPAAAAAIWWVYVPIHELLHVAGCVLPGGTVTKLEIAPLYGGSLLAKVFPFIVSGGEYAGRLSGFDTHGSDWIYLSTCFLPFVLTVLIGVPALKLAARRASGSVLFGLAVVVGLAPFYNLPGDYFEMGSIITTRVLSWFPHDGPGIPFAALRSDDVFKLIGTVITNPAELQLAGAADTARALIVILVSLLTAILSALFTYAAGSWWSSRILGRLFPEGRRSSRG